MPTRPHPELPDPTAAFFGPFETPPPRRNRIDELVREHEAKLRASAQDQIESVLDSTWDDGHAAGFKKGYRAGWRWGVLDGALLGGGLVALALWAGGQPVVRGLLAWLGVAP